jgi:hypothetical protein
VVRRIYDAGSNRFGRDVFCKAQKPKERDENEDIDNCRNVSRCREGEKYVGFISRDILVGSWYWRNGAVLLTEDAMTSKHSYNRDLILSQLVDPGRVPG